MTTTISELTCPQCKHVSVETVPTANACTLVLRVPGVPDHVAPEAG